MTEMGEYFVLVIHLITDNKLKKVDTHVHLGVDIVRMDPQAFEKNQKRQFFRDIQKSFQEVTPIGPEPHQFFSF